MPDARPPRLLRALAASLVALLALAAVSPAAAQEPTPSANESWLDDLYRQTLGRPGDDGGLDFWLGRIAGGGAPAREAVARSFVYSTEGSGIEVDRAYADLLERASDGPGREYWTDYLETHPVTSLRMLLIASDEYYLRYGAGADIAWLGAVYEEVLGRPADVDGLEYWLGVLDGGEARVNVVYSFYIGDESLERRARAYGTELLGRDLRPEELAEAVELIRDDDERAWRARLLAGDEYFAPYLEAVGLLQGGR